MSGPFVYAPSLVANALLGEAAARGTGMCATKLQQLLFLAHRESIFAWGKSVLSESPEITRFGPIFRSMQAELRGRGSEPVSEYMSVFVTGTDCVRGLVPPDVDPYCWSVVREVWRKYGNLDRVALAQIVRNAAPTDDQGRPAVPTGLRLLLGKGLGSGQPVGKLRSLPRLPCVGQPASLPGVAVPGAA